MRPQNIFLQFPQKILLFSKKLYNMKIFSIWFLIKKGYIFIFSVRWPLLKMVMPAKYFFPYFLQNCSFFRKKLLDEKIFKTSFPIKKVIFIFVDGHSFPSKETWPPETVFLPFSQKIQHFWKNSKIIKYSVPQLW